MGNELIPREDAPLLPFEDIGKRLDELLEKAQQECVPEVTVEEKDETQQTYNGVRHVKSRRVKVIFRQGLPVVQQADNEVINALVNLGYSRSQAKEASLNTTGGVEERIKQALQKLDGKK